MSSCDGYCVGLQRVSVCHCRNPVRVTEFAVNKINIIQETYSVRPTHCAAVIVTMPNLVVLR